MDLKQKMKSILGIDEMKNYRTLSKQLCAEFLGTFLYLSIALLANTNMNSNVALYTVQIALANGLLIATLVQIIGHVSGGHINPAVTMGVMVYGGIKVLRAVCYVAAQVTGAISGSYVAYACTTNTTAGTLGATEPYEHLRPAQIFGLEFIMTFTLVLVVLSALDPHKGGKGLGSTPLASASQLVSAHASFIQGH